MTGLCFLKDIKSLSDEEVCAVWCENPYFQHRFPVEPPSLRIFRARKKIKEVRNYLGRVLRNINGAAERGQMLSPTLEEALGKVESFRPEVPQYSPRATS